MRSYYMLRSNPAVSVPDTPSTWMYSDSAPTPVSGCCAEASTRTCASAATYLYTDLQIVGAPSFAHLLHTWLVWSIGMKQVNRTTVDRHRPRVVHPLGRVRDCMRMVQLA